LAAVGNRERKIIERKDRSGREGTDGQKDQREVSKDEERGSFEMKRKENSAYLIFILVLSVLAIIVLAIETIFKLDDATKQILVYADFAVCVVFFIDFLLLFFQAENKAKYFFTWGWLDLLSSIPVIEAFRLGRAIRIFRIIRVLRGIKSAKFITKTILEKKAQSAILGVILGSIILVVVGSISILHVESASDGNIKTAEDAVWWSIVTITTVGYGDKYPVTTEGRIIATIIMFAGVGVFGTISGFVASSFLTPSEKKVETEERDIRKELDEIKEMIREMKETGKDEG
jgi:voltage-gated potassium channel